MSTPGILSRPTLLWISMPLDKVTPAAIRNFWCRMSGSRGAENREIHDLGTEVIGRMLPRIHPQIAQVDLSIDSINSERVVLSGHEIPGGDWTDRIGVHDSVKLYCLSSGCRLADAADACGNDAVLSAAAHLFCNEIVFELTRRFDRAVRIDPCGRWCKVGLMSGNRAENRRCRWDPNVGGALFRAFAEESSPVQVTAEGSFDPLHTVLGMFCRKEQK